MLTELICTKRQWDPILWKIDMINCHTHQQQLWKSLKCVSNKYILEWKQTIFWHTTTATSTQPQLNSQPRLPPPPIFVKIIENEWFTKSSVMFFVFFGPLWLFSNQNVPMDNTFQVSRHLIFSAKKAETINICLYAEAPQHAAWKLVSLLHRKVHKEPQT